MPPSVTRGVAVLAAASLAASFTVAASAAPASSRVPVTAAGASPAVTQKNADDAPELYPCRGFGILSRTNTIADVDGDWFTWSPYRKVKVGDGHHDIDWRADPYRQDSWRTYLHTLNWSGAYVVKATHRSASYRDPAAIDGAVAIAADWVRDNPYPWPTGPGAGNATHTRTEFLLCLRSGLQKTGRDVPGWLDTTLLRHAEWLKKNTWRDHNVGTDQTLAVLGVGCTLGRRDLRDYAVSKLSGDITRVIDRQGANNEQALAYARYNHSLWGYADRAITTCGVTTTAARTITDRRAALLRFLDHAVGPDGTYAQLGDTQAEKPALAGATPAQRWILTDGKEGAPPPDRVRVYDAGYVFGRSGWGTGERRPSQESAYTLRFGPTRVGHGHSDHTALTWHALGRPILIDTGTGSYNADSWRLHYIGPTAHNEFVPAGMRNGSATRLAARTITPGADSYRLTDTPLPKITRTRDVIVLSDPEIVVTVDRARALKPTTFTQYWHLPTDVSLRRWSTRATASAGGVTTTLLQLPAAGVTASSFGATRGSTSPILGWYWPDYFHRYPAPVATVTRKGTAATVVTAVAAGPTAASVRTRISGATTTYTFTVGQKTAVVRLDAAGRLTRVG